MRTEYAQKRKAVVITALLAFFMMGSRADAAVFFTQNLQGAPAGVSPTPFIDFVVQPVDSNGDNWFETVFKVNVGDPALNNPFDVAEFRIEYEAQPTGTVNVNIGDSSTNNGGGGDGGTQSNDAEVNVGRMGDSNSLFLFGNDNFGGQLLLEVPNIVDIDAVLNLTISDEFFGYASSEGFRGSVNSEFLFALKGQPDSEGPVNYDVFASFNRAVDGSRIGTGVGNVTLCLRTSAEPACFGTVSGPGTTGLLVVGLSVFLLMARRARSRAYGSDGETRIAG